MVFVTSGPWGYPRNIFNKLDHIHGLDVAAHGYRGVVGAVPAQEEVLQVIYVHPVQVFYIADRQPAIGMSVRVQVLLAFFANQPIRTVIVILAAFIFNRGALHLEFLLCHRIEQEAHPVRFKPIAFF